MKKRTLFLALVLLTLSAFPAQQLRAAGAGDSPRRTTNFDKEWRFHLGDVQNAQQKSFSDKGWRLLDVPHDWSIEGENLENAPGGGSVGYFPMGIGWYRKTFNVPGWSREKRYSIEFDGVYMNSTVWLNGVQLGVRPYGYASFSYDLTPYLKASGNVIAVRVDNSLQPNSRWYSGSGIYRHVRLVETSPVHFGKWGVFNRTVSVADGKAVVEVSSDVVNGLGKGVDASVENEVIAPDGAVVARGTTSLSVAGGQTKGASMKMEVAAPVLWTLDNPALYTLRTHLNVDGREVDCVDNVMGIRTIEYDADRGFLLNGEHVKMKGVNLHHDAGGLGAAVPERVWERRLELLKESGCNAIRTAHNSPAPEFLDLCDRMGFLVMDEAFDEWAEGKNPYSYKLYFHEWHEQDLLAMVLRDRNHPSVVMWSIGNEVPDQSSAEGPAIARKLISICKANDPTRLVTAGNDRIAAIEGATPEYLAAFENEIVGYNYPDRWRERRELMYWVDKSAFPNRRVVATEASGMGGSRGGYSLGNDPMKVNASYAGSRFTDVEQRWKFTMLYDYVIGDFMWTGIDNYGESMWPSRIHSAGYLDNCGFKKDGFYFFRSLWTDKPTLHLFPHWNWSGREGQVIPVVCFTNCESVELFVNGKSYGRKTLEFPRKGVELGWNIYGEGKVFSSTSDLHLSWDVVYEPGEIVAVGIKDGKEYRERIVTTGEPASIRLSVDSSEIRPEWSDVAHVTVEILDKDGNVVPTADNLVKFSVEGAEIIGVENGNGRDLSSCKIPERKAYSGMCLAIVQARKSGDIKFRAESDGLQGAEIAFRAVK